MNIATFEQRQILEAHKRNLVLTRAPLYRRIQSWIKQTSHIRSILVILIYFFIFAVCFQASRSDFSTTSSTYLSQANGGRATTQKGASAPTNVSSSSKPVQTSAPALSNAPAVASLPATDQPSTAGPSNAVQFTATGYSYGQCTWYVSHRRPIPQNWGNARDWVRNSKLAGFTSGAHARPGAIAQTTAGYYGHVAYVEQVQDGKVYVSEMNYAAWNRITYRWANESDFTYIY